METFEQCKARLKSDDMKCQGDFTISPEYTEIFNEKDPETFFKKYREFWSLSHFDLHHEYSQHVN